MKIGLTGLILIFLFAVMTIPTAVATWEYARREGIEHRLTLPLVNDVVDVSIINVDSNKFTVAASKHGVAIYQVK